MKERTIKAYKTYRDYPTGFEGLLQRDKSVSIYGRNLIKPLVTEIFRKKMIRNLRN